MLGSRPSSQSWLRWHEASGGLAGMGHYGRSFPDRPRVDGQETVVESGEYGWVKRYLGGRRGPPRPPRPIIDVAFARASLAAAGSSDCVRILARVM